MRDIENYEEAYCTSDFEQKYQVYYRRKKILEMFNRGYRKILEVGCGMQSIGNFISDFEEFTIVEPGSGFIEKAKKDLVNRSGVYFVQGLLQEKAETLKNREFDLIIVSSLLHELEDSLKMLVTVKNLCGEKTIVHINVPNERSLHRILAYESGIIQGLDNKSERNVQLQQNCIYNLNTLEQLVRRSGGVTIMDKGSYFVKPFSHEQMEKCLNYEIFDERVLEGFDNLIKYIPELGSEIYINYRYLEHGEEEIGVENKEI